MWQDMIQDLRKAGLKYREIGEVCGIGRSSVHDLHTGRSKVPKGDCAIALQKLHRRVMRRKQGKQA